MKKEGNDEKLAVGLGLTLGLGLSSGSCSDPARDGVVLGSGRSL